MGKNKRLIILTKKFGYNFTGATLATHELLKHWVKEFDEVIVITRQVGMYDSNLNIKLMQAKSVFEVIKILKGIKRDYPDAVYYSDDHTGCLMKVCGVEYYHTYHGNWPDAKKVSFDFWLKSLFFIPIYKLTIKNAKLVINVSYYMEKYTRTINGNTIVIRNGLAQKCESITCDRFLKEVKVNDKLNIVMIGTIDKRKYRNALKLFNLIVKNKLDKMINIDIYGRLQDIKIAKALDSYCFVNLKGYTNRIELSKYDIFLHTSTIENLAISVCEAIVNKVPVICFNVGGIGEVVRNGINGFLVSKKDVDEMYRKLESIIEKGYTFVFDDRYLFNFDWKFAAEEYLKVFNIL